MKNYPYYLATAFVLFSSFANYAQNSTIKKISGTYQREKRYEKLQLNDDGTYILHNIRSSFTATLDICEYSSNGNWSRLADNILELTSANYYKKQDGFNFDLLEQSKFSQDSLYFEIIFPESFNSDVSLSFTFNYDNTKSILTNKRFVKVKKTDYFTRRHLLEFSVGANVSGIERYDSRILFRIFEQRMNFDKYNYFTITLPYFDTCFFQFKPYNKELIMIDQESLFWMGKKWERIKD